MSHFAAAEHGKEWLQYFLSAQDRDDLYQYNQEQMFVLEVLEDFPSVQVLFEWLVQLVPLLRTRTFSISSSPFAHRNQVGEIYNRGGSLSWSRKTPEKNCFLQRSICSTSM